MPHDKNVIRLLWAVLLVVFLATQLAGPLGHPYPTPVRPYVVYGGILLFVVGGLGFVAFVSRRRSRV